MNEVFTDKEYRLLLSALRREYDVCDKIDNDRTMPVGPDTVKLVPIVNSISAKLHHLQYRTDEMSMHYLRDQEPEWDGKNRFYRCPSCKRRIHEYHGFCKHCGKKIDWQPLMKKRKKEAEIKKPRGSKARITRRGLEEIARNREEY